MMRHKDHAIENVVIHEGTLKTLKRFTKKRIVGLGGINKNNLKYLKILELENFAGISYFKKKPPQ